MATKKSGTYTVVRNGIIAAPPSSVYPHIANFKNWQAWSPWEGIDPNLQRTYRGPEEGVGAKYEWAGNRKVGSGSMEITSAVPNVAVDMDLEFLKPFRASNKTCIELLPDTDGNTHISWSMTGKKTLMIKIMGIFKSMDSLVGKDFEKGIAQLKSVVEAK